MPSNTQKQKVAVLLSGGVDSSVSLALLAKENRYELTAYYLKIWLEDELQSLGQCPWEEDLKYARATCEKFNVPLEVIPLQREYHDRVVKYAIDELRAGHTPSPDIFCNQRIKFGAFLEFVGDRFDKVATGHYAIVEIIDGKPVLKMAVDPVKDQTYFLSHLSETQLARCLFPIGHLNKADVRTLAREFDLPTQDRKDSQGICFLGKIKYDAFVEHHLGQKKGEIRNIADDKKLGTHNGYWFHTIGQRKGLRLHGGPWFVVDKDVDRNIVYVAHATSKNARNHFWMTDINWIEPFDAHADLRVKVRHGAKTYGAKVSSGANQSLEVLIDQADAGIANGQFSVMYQNGRCIGAGRISIPAGQNN